METTRKQVTETTLIEECNGKFWPMYLTASGRYAYYKLNSNKNRSYRTEKGAVVFLSNQK